jgi:hypothetical protein
MLTRRIDAAIEALTACRARTPDLRDCYRQGAPERVALDALIAALDRAAASLAAPAGPDQAR